MKSGKSIGCYDNNRLSLYNFSTLRNKKRAKRIVELYKHAGFFKNTREVLEKHEQQANASRTSRMFLKTS